MQGARQAHNPATQDRTGLITASPPNRSWPPPHKILVKEVNWLGDLVISLPALRALHQSFPSSAISVLVKRELAGFFDGISWIAEVMPYVVRPSFEGVRDRLQIIRAIRERSFDYAVVFPNSFASALWVALAGIPRRAGYATGGRSLLLTDRARRSAGVMVGHQSGYWLAMVRQTAGAKLSPTAGRLEVAPRHRERMAQWLTSQRCDPLAPLIAIAPAAAYGPAKEWPASHYAGLIDLIAGQHGAECVLIGAPADRTGCEAIAATVRSQPIVAAGTTSIGELIALLSLCDGFTGNDSGAMHLASALGIPTVGIFGSTNPDRTGPIGPGSAVVYHRIECSPCLARTCRYGHYDCLRGIRVAEVASALERLGAFNRPRYPAL
ncbi:MAG: lipopolysaccharide heptosyltransferase II [Candidatus Binataceae bacterium]